MYMYIENGFRQAAQARELAIRKLKGRGTRRFVAQIY